MRFVDVFFTEAFAFGGRVGLAYVVYFFSKFLLEGRLARRGFTRKRAAWESLKLLCGWAIVAVLLASGASYSSDYESNPLREGVRVQSDPRDDTVDEPSPHRIARLLAWFLLPAGFGIADAVKEGAQARRAPGTSAEAEESEG